MSREVAKRSELLDYSTISLPKLVAFDLDGTIWTPDMYQLWGGGAPFRLAANAKDLLDRAGSAVRLLGVADRILHDLHSHPALAHVKVAWVSCTDEPEWAAECLEKFWTAGEAEGRGRVVIGQVAHSCQIFKSNKQTHFRNLKHQYPEIDFHDMLFFDNENYNIENVRKLGVKSYFARDGMTLKAWEEGLKMIET
ncbi:magnesium-dependent phosphatase-1 [archaeon]|nr:MAG: magnesium-dependent phosphatase-1 [archaeon]